MVMVRDSVLISGSGFDLSGPLGEKRGTRVTVFEADCFYSHSQQSSTSSTVQLL